MQNVDFTLKGIRADEMSFKLNAVRPQNGTKMELKPTFSRGSCGGNGGVISVPACGGDDADDDGIGCAGGFAGGKRAAFPGRQGKTGRDRIVN